MVNPNGLRNEIEGAIMMGIGEALFEEVRFAAGRIPNRISPNIACFGSKTCRRSAAPVIAAVEKDKADADHELAPGVVLQVSNADKFVAERLSCVLRLPNRKGCR